MRERAWKTRHQLWGRFPIVRHSQSGAEATRALRLTGRKNHVRLIWAPAAVNTSAAQCVCGARSTAARELFVAFVLGSDLSLLPRDGTAPIFLFFGINSPLSGSSGSIHGIIAALRPRTYAHSCRLGQQRSDRSRARFASSPLPISFDWIAPILYRTKQELSMRILSARCNLRFTAGEF